jgi:2-polyprenyl-3-methyl-5-hydroxy-6-metoxy-1,4-benzoquinol methylase
LSHEVVELCVWKDNCVTPVCPACASPRARLSHYSPRNRLTAGKCLGCGLRYIEERPTVAEQAGLYQDADEYREFVEAERSVGAAPERQRNWARGLSVTIQPAAFSARAGRRPRLLDIGCGAGDFLIAARDEGFAVHGLEISAAAAALARDAHHLDVQVGDYRAEQRQGYFDAVTLIGVLEHVLYPADLLQHSVRLLAPGGVLLIYTPVWGAYDRLASVLGRWGAGRWSRFIDRRINAAHLQIFPQATLTRLLGTCGLAVKDSRRLCEYNLPVGHYLQSMSVGFSGPGRVAAAAVAGLINRNLFFRNNQCVLAVKSA